jgi:hypothetical protein
MAASSTSGNGFGHGMAASGTSGNGSGNGNGSQVGYGREAAHGGAPAMQAGSGHTPRGADREYAEPMPFPRPPERPLARNQLTDLDIPTFIRRQMD